LRFRVLLWVESLVSEPDVLEEVERLIAALEAHPDPTVRESVQTLLKAIDAIHRTALEKLVAAIQSMAGEPFLRRMYGDPAIRLLLMSYDLVPVDRRLQAEEALDTVRGHLHAHGIDVDTEVVGGVVYARLHGARDPEAARRDVTEALKANFIGFQELVLRDRDREGPQPIVSLRRPVYKRALGAAELPPGTFKAIELDELPLLLANVSGDVYAVFNRCGSTPLPLEFGALSGPELRCSFHGCVYDVRTGKRLDVAGEGLRVFPVRLENGAVLVALGVS
jgi:3-phenylpropionate/trans-cinnamate dioxygenase ferredoxin subunit